MVDIELAQKIVDYLNELSKLDSVAITNLLNSRAQCNSLLANHKTCQVSGFTDNQTDEHYCVGILGILNGLCGIYDTGPKKNYGTIFAEFKDDDNGDYTLNRFCIQRNE